MISQMATIGISRGNSQRTGVGTPDVRKVYHAVDAECEGASKYQHNRRIGLRTTVHTDQALSHSVDPPP